MNNLTDKIPALKYKLGGQVLVPGDSEYDETRKLWNGMFDKRPAVIARCKSPDDVAESIKFARDNGLVVAVKGGGHSSAGTGSVNDGMMIDLSLMREVSVNAEQQTVTAQGGCLLSDVDDETQDYGLAVSAGVVSHTGVGGLTLGGGFGWISRKYGLTVDNLLSAEIITADGSIVNASEKENKDLFWAIRGGGGNFGIVTNFEFKAANIGTELYSGLIIKNFDNLKEFIRFHRKYVRTLPDEMTVWVIIRHAPPLPFLKEKDHGRLVIVVAFAWLGDETEGKKLMQPYRETAETLAEAAGMNPWLGWQSTFDPLAVHGARNYWKSNDMPGLPDDLIDVVARFATQMPTDECEVFIPHMEGAPSRKPDEDTAFSYRKVPFLLNIHTRWQVEEQDEKCLKWAREFHEAFKPFSHGVYVNFLSDEGKNRTREAYSDAVWTRLVEIKRKWDPDNFFHVNQNISPNRGL